MGFTPRSRRIASWMIVPLSITAWVIGATIHAGRSVHAGQTAPPSVRSIQLGAARPGALYALTLGVKDPAQLQGNDAVHVTVNDAQGEVDSKWLHAADLDFYLTLKPRAAGPVTVNLSSASGVHTPDISSTLTKILQATVPAGSAADLKRGVISAAPNGTWQNAQSFELGQTIFGGDDERPYAPSKSEDAYAAMVKGFQWFHFTFREKQPKLVYFVLNVTDRDIPLDVDIFQMGKDADGHADVVPFNDGEFVYQVEATQNYPGLYKFRTRILQPGQEYYVRVDADHPAYQLHTYQYSVPPNKDPHEAVRAGMDFLINMGDTWLSNTPRRGAIAMRTTMQHSETQLCIACHPSQFTTRGYLKAVQNGYAPTQRASLEFLTDRIYNNPRPLYGEPGTNWVRMIYTARTEASRLPMIEHSFEQNVTHDPPRKKFDLPYASFLKIHYKGVTVMPGDEADGCEPDVSPFEIAEQSWHTFDLAFNETHKQDWITERDHVEQLALPDEPKNVIDLNWKIMFLSEVNREKYASQINALIDKLYEYETADGGWPYPFDKTAKTADFVSYNAVLALAEAGHRPETDEHLGRAVKAMLAAQRPEGSWEGDPVYQGFNTPFRATQFAVMALSTLYPGTTKAKTWDAGYPAPATTLAKDDLPLLLQQLDQYWDLAPESELRQIRKVLSDSDQPLAREAAARDQAQVLAKVLREGTPLGREGLLNALWDFHIRHYALPAMKADTVSIGLPAVLTKYITGVPDLHRPGYEYSPYRETVDFKYDVHNGFFQTRVGNDSDLIHFFKSSGPELEDALLACLQGADNDMKIEVLKAGSTLSEAGDARFTLAALNLSEDPNAEVRQTVRYVYESGQRGILNLDTPSAPDPHLVGTVVEILKHGNPDSQAVVLPLLASLPASSAWEQQAPVLDALRGMLEAKPKPANYAQVLDAASSFSSLMQEPKLQEQVLAGLHSFNPDIQRAAVRISFEHFLNDPQTVPAVKAAYATLNNSALSILLEEAGNPEFLKKRFGVAGGAVSQDQDYLNRHAATLKIKEPLEYPIVVDTVMASLLSSDANVSAAALDTLRKVKNVEQRPDFRAAMDKLQNSGNPRLKLISTSVLQGKNLGEALRDVQPGSVLDFRYFVTKVEPILAKPGPDGKACVFCHASHVIFKLNPPSSDGNFSDQDSVENYKYAMRVVDITNPDKSLLVIKPTRPTDSAGNVGDYLATHNGGQRWHGNESSDQYRTILEWIRGGRLEASNQAK